MRGIIKTLPTQNTRQHFVNSLIKLAGKNSDIILLTGDLGHSFFEPFIKQFPKQFINCGVIEQSMVGIAVGLALAGKKPYVYSTSTFLVFRAAEQIRNDVCYQNNNVKLAGTAGKQWNFLGYTHIPTCKEDIKVLNLFPNIRLYEPSTQEEMDNLMEKEYQRAGPAYFRL